MKRIAAPAVFLFACGVAAHSESPFLNELAFAARAVSAQLRQDHAPEKVIKDEASLLSQAETVIRGTQARVASHGTSFLANRARSAGQSSHALATQVAREVEFASKAVEVQLGQDHVPAALVQAEKGLLAKAAAAAQNAEHALGNAFALKGREDALEQRLHLAAKETHLAKASAVQEFAAAERAEVKQVRDRLKQTQYVEDQARKALQGMHTSATKQMQLSNLLAEVEKGERSELTMSQHAAESTQRLESELAAVNHAKKAARSEHTVHKKLFARQSLDNLERTNSALRAANKQLKGEHVSLVHEERLVEDNAALAKANAKLESQNAELQQKLAA